LPKKKTLTPHNPSVLTPKFPDPDCPGTPCPAHTYWRSEGGARCSRGGENPTETCTYLVTSPGSRHGLGAQPGTWSPRIPAMASSQSDVRPSPTVYPAVRPPCQNSRPGYPYGQTRALPLSSTTCSARASPSTILRHRPPVTRSVRSSDLHQIDGKFTRYSPSGVLPVRVVRGDGRACALAGKG
jgi:hypothetical protein